MCCFKTKKEYALAIATGCWEDTATLKLNIAGIDYDEIPLANRATIKFYKRLQKYETN